MKIVIAQHECFDVPINIVKRYFELKGEIPYFYDRISDHSVFPTKEIYTFTYKPKDDYNTFIVTKNFGEICTGDDIYSDAMFEPREIGRTDLIFIKAVEELKPENLKVVEIPDDVKWYIHESEEGLETIHEEHRIWY